MADEKLQKIWMTAAAKLRHARQMLPGDVSPAELTQFDEYLDHKELELALQELEQIGRKYKCLGGFWRNMQRVADTMNLTQDAECYRQEFDRSLDRTKDDV